MMTEVHVVSVSTTNLRAKGFRILAKEQQQTCQDVLENIQVFRA